MAVKGHIETYGITAAESFSDARAGLGHLFKAVRVDSGLIATNGRMAVGLLQSLANVNENATLAIGGVSKYVAAAAITPGAELTVTTSGYLTTAASGSRVVGRNGRSSVTSGSVGHGLFWNLVNPQEFDQSSAHINLYQVTSFTAANAYAAGDVGKGVNIASGAFPDAAHKATGVVIGTASTSGATFAIGTGLMLVRAGGVIASDRALQCAASGWFTHAASGDRVVGRAVDASAAGNSGGTFRAVVNMAGTIAAFSHDNI